MILGGPLPDMGTWFLVIIGALVALLAPTGGAMAGAVAGTWRGFWLGMLAFTVVGPTSAVVGLQPYAAVGLGWSVAWAVGLALRPQSSDPSIPDWSSDEAELHR